MLDELYLDMNNNKDHVIQQLNKGLRYVIKCIL